MANLSEATGVNAEIDLNKNLFDNHLEFLRTHRGKTEAGDEATIVISEKEEFTFAIPGKHGASLNHLQQFKTFYVAPWSGDAESHLRAFGFHQSHALNYMVRGTPPEKIHGNSALTIIRVQSPGEMEDFSTTQSNVFTDTEEEYNEWYPWLREANFKNLQNSDQFFYVAYENNQPVGTALAVQTGKVTGIYAVATLSGHRKKGISTSLMSRIFKDAAESGSKTIALQVVKGSYAESFYKKLGFNSAFEMKIYSKKA